LDSHQRYANDAAEFQLRDALLRPDAIFAQRVEVHREQVRPLFQGPPDDTSRNAQVARIERCPLPIARHAGFQIVIGAQQQKSAFGPGDCKGGIYDRFQNFIHRKRAL